MKSVHFWTNFELAKGVPHNGGGKLSFGRVLHHFASNEIHQQLGTFKCLGEYSFEGKGFELMTLNMALQKQFG